MIKLNSDKQLGHLIENQFGESYLFSIHRRNIEKLDYKTQFNKEFSNSFSQKDTLYIIAGTDSGLMVNELLKTPPEKGSAYLFIEFPEIIQLTHSQYDLSEQKRIIVTTEEKWQDEAQKIGLDIYFMLNRVQRIKSFGAQYYFLGEYLFLWQAIEASANHLSWQYQSQLGSKLFVQRQLENLTENHSPAVVLTDYFKGKSALILAGGPSLDNYIEWIEENQAHYVVIAVTRIARRLLQTQIKPDFFISVDPYVSNFNVSKEVFNYENDSILINQYHITPMLVGNWLGANLYLGQLLPWQSKLNKENLPGIGPTVTNSAILLAINMGIKQQILFGVDLCYSPDGYTHAKGSNEHENGPNIREIGQIVITNNGDKAETNSAYYEAITTIENLAELARQSGGRLVNPSPDAARMNNVDHTLVEDITVNKDRVSAAKFLQAQITKNNKEHFKVTHYQNILKELKSAQLKIKKVADLANKGLKYNEQFFSDDNPEANFKYKLKMDKIEKELNHKQLTHFSELSKKFGVNELLYFLNPDSGRELSNEEIKQSGEIYYKALKSGANNLGRHVFTAINRTEVRLLENNKLTVNNELIGRHLNHFNKSVLLNREIENQKSAIKKEVDKQSKEQILSNKKHLELLNKKKKECIKDCKQVSSHYFHNEHTLGTSHTERTLSISFYLYMIQNENNYQTRRLLICEKENPDLLCIPEYILFADKSPSSFIQTQHSINNTLKTNKEYENLVKLKNQISNLADNNLAVNHLSNYFKNHSSIILADSNTLFRYSQWIEKNQDYFIIIALSHLAQELLLTTIKPDFFIATTVNELNFDKNKALINYENDCILINQHYLTPKILGNWLGINFYLGNLFPWEKNENNNDVLEAEDDDTRTAIAFSTLLGINQCVIFSDNEMILSENTNPSDNHHTKIVCSSFSDSINKISIPKKSVELVSILKEKHKAIKSTEFKANHYKQVLEHLNQTYSKLEHLQNKINQFIHYQQKLSQKKQPDDLDEIIKAINHLEENMKQNDLSNLIETSNQLSSNNQFDSTYKTYSKKPLDLNNRESIISQIKNDINYYNSLKTGLYALSREIFTAINCLEVRLLELNQLEINDDLIKRHLCTLDMLPQIDLIKNKHSMKARLLKIAHAYSNKNRDFGSNDKERKKTMKFFLLVKGYSFFQHYRRIRLIETTDPQLLEFSETASILGKKTISILNNLKRMANKVSGKVVADSINFEGIEIKLYNLFTLKDEAALTKIIKNIEMIDDIDADNLSFLHLAKGYLYEIQSHTDQAIEEYGQAVFHKTRESALKQIVFITLDNGQINFAHNALQLLTEISPDYLPQLAELYYLSKNYQDAMDIYSQYLDYNSTDISVLLKVGKLYESQNIFDGAEYIYNQVIKLEPDNAYAQKKLNEINNTA